VYVCKYKTLNHLISSIIFSTDAYFHLFVCKIIELARVDITNKHLEMKVREKKDIEVRLTEDFVRG